MKYKFNVISIILGLILIVVSVFIGYTNNFQGGEGLLLLLLGTALALVGFVFTPKIWGACANILDIIVMFFNRSWFAVLNYCDLEECLLGNTLLLYLFIYYFKIKPFLFKLYS